MSTRSDPKALQPSSNYQARRRAAALERQRTARREAASRARKLALSAAESEDSSEAGLQVGGGHIPARRLRWRWLAGWHTLLQTNR